MAKIGHYLGSILGLISAVGIMVTTIHHEWKQTSNVNSPLHLQFLHLTEGIWLRCVYPTPGLAQCDYFGTSILGLPGKLHAMRAMVVLSELIAFTGVVIAFYSLPCTRFVKKRLLGIIAGACMIVAGILCIIPVSMYAAEVVEDFSHQHTEIKYTFGPALYVGWVSSGIAMLSGGILILCAKNVKQDYSTHDDGGVKSVYI